MYHLYCRKMTRKELLARGRDYFRRFEGSRWMREAELFLDDEGEMGKLLRLMPRMLRKKAFIPVLKDLILAYLYVSDVVKGRYKDFSGGKLVLLVAMLAYVVSPFDFVPDWLPGGGLLDDAALVGYAVHLADKELQRYYQWNRLNRKRDDEPLLEE